MKKIMNENHGNCLEYMKRSLLVLLYQFCAIVLMLVCAIVRIMLSTTCEETTVLGGYLIKYSRFYSSFSKTINKKISSKEWVFISLVGPSESGKSHLIFDWLKLDFLKPAFDKIFYFYQHYQPHYNQMQKNKASSSKQIRNRFRVTKCTHNLVQVAEGCFTNQYIKSTSRSRISIERVVSRCNIRSLWSFTHWFNPKNSWFT